MAAIQLRHVLFVSLLPPLGGLLNGFYNGPLYRLAPPLFWLADLTLFVIAPTAVAYWLARLANVRPRHYGLNIPPNGGMESLVTSLLFAFVLVATYEAARYIGWLFTWRWYVEPDFSYGAITPNGPLRPIIAVYWALTAGLMESVFYIGLPWYIWRDRLGLAHRRRPFLWLSALAFAAVHWEQGSHNVIGAFAFGFVACLLYWKVSDLWPVVGAHVMTDILSFA